MDKDFKLGPPLLKTSDQTLPDTWRSKLLREYLDGASRTSIAATSKAGLSWALSECPKATLRLTVDSTGPDDSRLVRRFLQAAEQLRQRGRQHSTVVLRQRGDLQQGWWWLRPLAAQVLPPTFAPMTIALLLDVISETLLTQLGIVFPGICGVVLGSDSAQISAPGQLPAPGALPRLTYLRVWRVNPAAAAALWSSLAPYIPQLQTLHISEQLGMSVAAQRHLCASLFSAATQSNTLTGLTLPCALTPRLAILLQKHTPR